MYRSTPPNFQPFQEFMKAISEELKVQASVIHDVFPPKADVYYIFADRVFEDVVSMAERKSKQLGTYKLLTSFALRLQTISV